MKMMIWLGIGLLIAAFLLVIFRLGSQFVDVIKLDFSAVGENIMWLIFSFILGVVGVVIIVIGFINLFL
jgi:hypothetical protein